MPGANSVLSQSDWPNPSPSTTNACDSSNAVVASLDVPYRWLTSYVAGDKLYCVHEADDDDAILEHARRGGFPADTVAVIVNEIGPHTAGATAMP